MSGRQRERETQEEGDAGKRAGDTGNGKNTRSGVDTEAEETSCQETQRVKETKGVEKTQGTGEIRQRARRREWGR